MEHDALTTYAERFSRLRTDKSRARWSSDTLYRAPHKPLLLLAVMDSIADGVIQSNLIELTPDLGELFSVYWSLVVPMGRLRGNIAMPFWHLTGDGFWSLLPRPGKEHVVETVQRIHAISVLQETIIGARLETQLYELMLDDHSRDALRAVLIQIYFAEKLHRDLSAQSLINRGAEMYGNDLLAKSDRNDQLLREIGEEFGSNVASAVRDQGFRRAIVRAYNHRCAICGVRILTQDGHTAISAAHIIPWSISHDDDPRNGLALCGLCHWTFDEGLVTMTDGLVIRFSPQISKTSNVPGHLVMFENRGLHEPNDLSLRPAKESLQWHRRNVFQPR